MNQIRSPAANLREHLHTQGRTRANASLEPGLTGTQRGQSLNIQELHNHYHKNGSNTRNVTYYNTSKVPGYEAVNNNYVSNNPTTPQNNSIFVPGSMRFAVMN